MKATSLPERNTMLQAFLGRDTTYDGVFYTGVRTTGIFCRPTCSARKPLPEHVDFYPSANAALQAGFRPCKRCRPMEPRGTPPGWLRDLLRDVDADPSRRWTDDELRSLGLSPDRVRRWFQSHHGMTFHAYSRSRRLGSALGQIQQGDNVSRAAFAHGYDSLSGFQDAFRQILETTPAAARDATVVTINRIPTPLGPMLVGATDRALCLLEFTDRRMLETQFKRLQHRLACVFVPGENEVLQRAATEVASYFAGELNEFTVPIDYPGTEFQTSVWRALLKIPHGATASYADVARTIGRPTAVRAVARANGDNRIAIIIPCHRVIGSDGKLTGYGGGLWRKKRLLEVESGQLTALE